MKECFDVCDFLEEPREVLDPLLALPTPPPLPLPLPSMLLDRSPDKSLRSD